MAYNKTNWTPTTPINPSNLNKIEEGIRQNAADIENLNSNLDNFFKKNCDNYINNILNISYSTGNEYDTLNDNGVIATEDASVLVNSPVTSGAFYAYREVLFIKSPLNNNKIIVRLTEAYPEPGRIWLSVYNMDLSTWSNWRCI